LRTALITGVNGQDGSYLAEWLLKQGYCVVGLVGPAARGCHASTKNICKGVQIITCSLLDDPCFREILERYRPQEVYNFAGRASSSHLFSDPVLTGEVNGMAVLRMLDAIRTLSPEIRFCQASSSEMFGMTPHSPQSESTSFRPRNPYGVAKLFAHGMVGMYRDRFGVFACSSILFNHESPRRGEEFVTRKITRAVARIKVGLEDSLTLGSLDATRDWGYAGDYVRAMWHMLQAEVPDDYVVATGESHSVRELCELAFGRVGLDYRDYVRSDPSAERPPESVRLVGDATKIRTTLRWRPEVSFEDLVYLMIDADLENVIGQGDRQPENLAKN
jgi:GDPmannose 4,6-dehydratase